MRAWTTDTSTDRACSEPSSVVHSTHTACTLVGTERRLRRKRRLDDVIQRLCGERILPRLQFRLAADSCRRRPASTRRHTGRRVRASMNIAFGVARHGVGRRRRPSVLLRFANPSPLASAPSLSITAQAATGSRRESQLCSARTPQQSPRREMLAAILRQQPVRDVERILSA